MKWISVDKYLPGKELPDNGWVIVRVINKCEMHFYLMADYNCNDNEWEFMQSDVEEKYGEIEVTHWILPDQID